MAHYEPPHQDLRCLQIQLFSTTVVKELTDSQTALQRCGLQICEAAFLHNVSQLILLSLFSRNIDILLQR